MRSNWREFSGFGELLCLVLAWTVGLAAMWAEYAGQDAQSPAKVAVSNSDRSDEAYFD